MTISTLCPLLGVSRQSFYAFFRSQTQQAFESEIIIQEVIRLRVIMPQIGGRKLFYLMQDFIEKHRFIIGRDLFFDVLREHQLLVRRRKSKKPKTTFSSHWLRKYDNLIVDIVVNTPNQVWVSDITYIVIGNGFGYLFLITDAYSRKIIGYAIEISLATEGAVKALKMAIRQRTQKCKTIHHSDRGIQYCSWDYTDRLNKAKIAISMTQNSDPRENAIAERVNGILKTELLKKSYPSIQEAQEHLPKVISIYNVERPHSSIDFMTPTQAHTQDGSIKRRWKNYLFKSNNLGNVQNGVENQKPENDS